MRWPNELRKTTGPSTLAPRRVQSRNWPASEKCGAAAIMCVSPLKSSDSDWLRAVTRWMASPVLTKTEGGSVRKAAATDAMIASVKGIQVQSPCSSSISSWRSTISSCRGGG